MTKALSQILFELREVARILCGIAEVLVELRDRPQLPPTINVLVVDSQNVEIFLPDSGA